MEKYCQVGKHPMGRESVRVVTMEMSFRILIDQMKELVGSSRTPYRTFEKLSEDIARLEETAYTYETLGSNDKHICDHIGHIWTETLIAGVRKCIRVGCDVVEMKGTEGR